jgi:hypothetical protein
VVIASVAAVAVVAIIITMRIVATEEEEEEEEEEETETAAAVAQERTRGRIDRAGAILCLAFYSNAVVGAEEARGRAGGAAVPSARLATVDRVEAKECGCSRRRRRCWCRSIGTPAARLLNSLILPANNTQ